MKGLRSQPQKNPNCLYTPGLTRVKLSNLTDSSSVVCHLDPPQGNRTSNCVKTAEDLLEDLLIPTGAETFASIGDLAP